MAFYPLLMPVFLAAGYDAMVGISVILLGAGAGIIGSTVNPFATGIASGFAGISLGDGLVLSWKNLKRTTIPNAPTPRRIARLNQICR